MAVQQRLDNGASPRAVESNNAYDSLKNVPRSFFDLSRLHSTTVDIGALVPIDCLKVVPGDEIELSQDMFVTALNPMVRKMINGCWIYTHTYYSRCNDLWKGWNNYLTKGRSGNISKVLPSVDFTLGKYHGASWNVVSGAVDFGSLYPLSPMSLAAYLGVPPHAFIPAQTFENAKSHGYGYVDPLFYASQPDFSTEEYAPNLSDQMYRSFYTSNEATALLSGEFSDYRRYGTLPVINALPFAMYQRIYRDYYLNKNLSQSNKNWFPDDEDEFILPYAPLGNKCTHLGLQSDAESDAVVNVSPYVVRNGDVKLPNGSVLPSDVPALPFLRYRQRRTDDFTSGLPWQQRGDQLNLFGASDRAPILGGSSELAGSAFDDVRQRSSDSRIYGTGSVSGSTYDSFFTANLSGVALSANRIRELFVLSQWQERAARTNGDYNALVKANTSVDPNWRDRTPIYIGGTRQQLVYTEVLQTSANANTPLGTQAGRAISAASGNIGRFKVPDYGYIMTIVSIVPDENYSQGIEKFLNGGTSFADEYFPAFQNLAPEPILNKEIDYKGISGLDENIFAWRERYSYMKTRQNRVSGWLAASFRENDVYASYTFMRQFGSSVPTGDGSSTSVALNNQFVTLAPPTVRRDMFTVPTEPMFLLQVASRVKAVRPLAYQIKPASLNGVAM